MTPAPQPVPAQRLVSLDVLRGFDMFWIVGAGSLVHGLQKLSDAAPITFLADQLNHVRWEGFHFNDLIFPLFVFITGVSTAFAIPQALAKSGRNRTLWKIAKRALILYALGLFYYSGSKWVGDDLRYVGVLQRIAFCYLATGILFTFLKVRGLIATTVLCLVGYWALMTFVPVPGIGAGSFEQGKNLCDWLDSQYLPGAKFNGDYDPEGLLSHIPAVATCLLGLLCGLLMKNQDLAPLARVKRLIIAGALCASAGWLWNLQFPVIKSIWTSSFVLVAGGYSMLLLALFYWLVDIRGGDKRWTVPMLWIGTNPITIYMVFNMVGMHHLAERIVIPPIRNALGSTAGLVTSLLTLALGLLLLRFMYNRRIFLRI